MRSMAQRVGPAATSRNLRAVFTAHAHDGAISTEMNARHTRCERNSASSYRQGTHRYGIAIISRLA